MLRNRFIAQQLINLAAHLSYLEDKLLKRKAVTPETGAFLVPLRRGLVFKITQDFKIRTCFQTLPCFPLFLNHRETSVRVSRQAALAVSVNVMI